MGQKERNKATEVVDGVVETVDAYLVPALSLTTNLIISELDTVHLRFLTAGL